MDTIKPNTLYLSIYSPNYKSELAFAGYIKSLSSVNEKGPFDILPLHENLATVATGTIVIVDEGDKRVEFNVQKAVIDVSNNLVKVFVEY